ncbi:rhomboid family intramembrane serine protease [Sphingobacterium bambusae]|uniref:Rhomboid family intramembrane serine protease n=1 Tax=Sphingobacterium bambusae TaxID=662858 RepID=A0ABW6BG26_9SPHI|nr:rhomboid family intramembrane serine protease [Sphingobacterium bambusae]WPL50702.1 rhomboid family intramembrane serine protease [Sphingobacterium bambusae]
MFSNLTTVVKNLLIANVIFFIGSQLIPQVAYTYLPAFYPDSPHFYIWQVITYMFMHADFGHIFFNMFSLIIFGPILEQTLGSKRFINFYLVCGLGALLLHFSVDALRVFQATGTLFPYRTGQVITGVDEIYLSPILGASGSVFGILLGFAYLYPNMRLMLLFPPIPIKAKYLVGGLIVIELYMVITKSGGNIAHMAHIGGALFAYLMMKLWGIRKGY